jgi:hypothetical protein
MQLAAAWRWMQVRQRMLAYGVGCGFIAAWTLLRFLTQRSIFDLVSQQVIVRQWLHGALSPAHMGQTAYLPKMALYALMESLPGSPRLKLILITVIINLATFVLLGLVLEKLLGLFRVRASGAFYGSLVLLSMIAGSVFWIEFANSRNLEVVGGMFWLYLGLRFLQKPSWRQGLRMAAFGSLLFFDDPLQLYMIALPLVVYICILAAMRQERVTSIVKIIVISGVAWSGAQVLFTLSSHWLQVSFHDTGGVNTPALSLDWLLQSGKGSLQSLVSLLAGAADAGRVREAANLLLLVSGAVAWGYAAARHLVARRLILLLACVATTDLLVYVASGQAVQGGTTARYLIMIAPVVIVAGGAVRWPHRMRGYMSALIILVIGLNALALGAVLLRSAHAGFRADRHLASVQRYVRSHPGAHVYASIDTAMPVLYFYALPANRSLPVGCLADKLVRTHFSMDAAFIQNTRQPNAAVAIILDGDAITNQPNVCTQNDIANQFGQPLTTWHTDDGSSVLLYRQASIHLAD